mgnify:FL=1
MAGVPELCDVLVYGDAATQQACACALGKIGKARTAVAEKRQVAQSLAACYGRVPVAAIREAIREACYGIIPMNRMIDDLDHYDLAYRTWCAAMFGSLQETRAVAELRDVMTYGDAPTREACARALRQILGQG